MIKNVMSLKDKIDNISRDKGVSKQVLLQNYMFERILERISISKYRDNFILKGGLLLSSIFGVDTRTTMDMDATIKGIDMSLLNLTKIIEEILNIDLNDDVKFEIIKTNDIKKEDIYGGYSFKIKALYENLKVDLSVDISTGDVITPREIVYKYSMMFEKKNLLLMAYNNETILAEKFQTILSRGIGNGRMKDYYDFYKFWTTQEYLDIDKLRKAIMNTFKNRNTLALLDKLANSVKEIEEADFLKRMWTHYQNQNDYAKNISFNNICVLLIDFINVLEIETVPL